MTKFRKKPVVVEAVQFTRAMAEGREPLPAGVRMISRTLESGGRFPEYADDGKHLVNFSTCHRHVIPTLEGDMDVQIGDWIITGVKGEHYPCKPDIFEMTYEPVTQPSALQAEIEALRETLATLKAENEKLAEALKEIRSRSSMDLAKAPNPFAHTAVLSDIHQIAGAALAEIRTQTAIERLNVPSRRQISTSTDNLQRDDTNGGV